MHKDVGSYLLAVTLCFLIGISQSIPTEVMRNRQAQAFGVVTSLSFLLSQSASFLFGYFCVNAFLKSRLELQFFALFPFAALAGFASFTSIGDLQYRRRILTGKHERKE
jgi:hypothetical protein